MKRDIEVSFLVPLQADTHLGNGQLHNPAKWRVLHERLYEIFGGWTCTGTVEGCYRDPDTGQPVFDVSRRYVIACEATRLDEVRVLLSQIANTFVQKSIYMACASEVEFIHGASEHGTLFDTDEP